MSASKRLAEAGSGFVVGNLGLTWTTDSRTVATWRAAGSAIVEQAEGALWALGDWLVSGLAWEMDTLGFEVAARVTGYSRSHLGRAYNQAVAWPRATRRLPWSVLNQIRRLPEGQRAGIVERAVTAGWTLDQTFAAVTTLLRPANGPVPVASSPAIAPSARGGRRDGRARRRKSVTCPHCGKSFELRAAGVIG